MMVQEKLSSQDSQHRVLAVYTLSVLAENAGEQIRGNLKEFLNFSHLVKIHKNVERFINSWCDNWVFYPIFRRCNVETL